MVAVVALIPRLSKADRDSIHTYISHSLLRTTAGICIRITAHAELDCGNRTCSDDFIPEAGLGPVKLHIDSKAEKGELGAQGKPGSFDVEKRHIIKICVCVCLICCRQHCFYIAMFCLLLADRRGN